MTSQPWFHGRDASFSGSSKLANGSQSVCPWHVVDLARFLLRRALWSPRMRGACLSLRIPAKLKRALPPRYLVAGVPPEVAWKGSLSKRGVVGVFFAPKSADGVGVPADLSWVHSNEGPQP